ncbi:G-protein coupled receptor 55 [Anabas testudineus]|uniref:G-protein coupled receptors family 1 profile domain-containing protein n=1 Tax=Anabas testudineus TaxID=64144 RepID=A0A3Q1INP1_ANATE|nr:G-protein coupled receptor 55 [Anabas testudineus]
MYTNATNTTCTEDLLQGWAYSLLFLLGFLLNAAALRAFIARRNSWTDTDIYMFNLAIADTALVLFLPFRIYDAFFCLPKTYLCTLLICIHFLNMYASILTTTAISVHRYLTIKFPLQARSWRRKKETAFAVCLLLWLFLVTICAVFRDDNAPDKLWTCYQRCKNERLKTQFVVILLLLGFLVPLIIVVFCSSQMIYILLKGDDKSEERRNDKSEQKKNIVGMITANLIVFIVCYTPIHVGFLVIFFYNPPPDWQQLKIPAYVYFLVSEWIASTNCCLDSFSYCFLMKQFYS